MKNINSAIILALLGVTLLFTAAGAGDQLIHTATATGTSNPITIPAGQLTGLKMKLANVIKTSTINPSCKFEVYNQWGQLLWRSPTYSSDYEYTRQNYFTYKNGKRYYKNTNKEVQGLKIKTYISWGTATMSFYMVS